MRRINSLALALLLVGAQQKPDARTLELLEKLEGEEWRAAHDAAEELAKTADPSLLPELFKRLETSPPRAAGYAGRVIGALAGPEHSKKLLSLLKSHPDRTKAVLSILPKTAGPEAEAGLLEVLESRGEFLEIRALGMLGGVASQKALRKHLAGLPEGDRLRYWTYEALVRLRDPEVARLIVRDVRAGRTALWKHRKNLLRLGDPRIVEGLVAFLKEGKPKIDDQKAAIELIGLLGGKEHLDLLLEKARDPRFVDAAAVGLAELGDAKAARPLAEALKLGIAGRTTRRVLMELSLEGAHEPLLEILSDVEGHDRSVDDALRLAKRNSTQKLKAPLLKLLLDPEIHPFRRKRVLDAALPLVTEADAEFLREGAMSREADVTGAALMALAAIGGEERLTRFLEWAVRHGQRTFGERTGNLLLSFPKDPPGMMKAVAQMMKREPHWLDGAEYLTARGKEEGLPTLRDSLTNEGGRLPGRAAKALLEAGDPAAVRKWVDEYLKYSWDEANERLLAKGLAEGDVAALRKRARASGKEPNRSATRVLALRGDEKLLFEYRRAIRLDHLDSTSVHSNIRAMTEGLAKASPRQAVPELLKVLRSKEPGRRVAALSAFGLIEDRAHLDVIVPFLADREELPWFPSRSNAAPLPIRRVRDAAVSAIEVLSGRTFEGRSHERAALALAWYRETHGK